MKGHSFLFRFGLLSAIAILLLGLLLGQMLKQVIQARALTDARAEGQVLSQLVIQPLLQPSDLVGGFSPARTAALDQALTPSLRGEDFVEVKIWNRHDQVVYSNDHSLIGRSFAPSDELESALDGHPASEVSNLQKQENAGQVAYGQLLEVYTPIVFDAGAAPVGAFEVDLPYRPVADAIARDTQQLYLVLLGGLALLYAALFPAALAADRLRRREGERLKQILEVLPQGVTIVDAAGRWVMRNRAADHTLGGRRPASLTDAYELSKPRHFDGSPYPPSELPLARALRGEVVGGEQVLFHNESTGRDVPVLVTAAPLREPGGKLAGAVSGLQDISAIKAAQDALRASESRLRAILDSALDGVITMDAAGLITDWNPRAEAIFGWSRAEAIGRSVAETVIPPRLRPAHNRGLAHFLETGKAPLFNTHTQIPGLHRDGHEFPAELSITPVQLEGTVTFTAFVQDITERKGAEEELQASEERFRRLFEQTPVGMAFAGPDMKIRRANEAFCRMLGYTEEELTGLSAVEITHRDDIAPTIEQVDQLLKGNSPSYRLEKRYLTKTGEIVWGDLTTTLIRDRDGKPLYMQSVIENITDRKQGERRLAAQYAITRVLAVARSLDEAGPRILRELCETLGWGVGTIWTPDPSGQRLRCLDYWRMPSDEPDEWEATVRAMSFEPGTGLAGRIWAAREPMAITDLHGDPRFLPDSPPMRAGLRGACGFPVLAGDKFLGAIVLMRRKAHQADADLLKTFASMGSQIGEFLERIEAEQRLRRQLDFTSTITTTVEEVIYVVDHEGRVTFLNPAAEKMLGWTEAELMGKPLHDLVHFQRADGTPVPAEACPMLAVMRTGTPFRIADDAYTHRDGTILAVDVTSAPIVSGGRTEGAVISLRDITERKRAEAALRQQADVYEPLLRAQSDLGEIIMIAQDEHLLFANDAFYDLLGLAREGLGGISSFLSLVVPEERAALQERLRLSSGSHLFETNVVRPDGRRVDLEVAIERYQTGDSGRLIVLARDISERKQALKALEHQALHDVLTDLPNRTLLMDRLEQGILNAGRQHGAVGLLLLDLDHFKDVNDTFGHHAGDALLRQVGARLSETLRSTDTVARLGGDEFAIVLPGSDGSGSIQVARNLLKSLDRAFAVENQAVAASASIGIAICPEHGEDAKSLLRRADIAMYIAKQSGGGYALYTSDQDQHSPGRLALMAELRQAIDEEQLVLYYQPLVPIGAVRPTGMEALVRWEHPSRGLVPPAEFIPFAERTGLIKPISEWVLQTALRQCRRWSDAGHEVFVSVNLSARNLLDSQLSAMIGGLLEANHLPPGCLILEITESVLMAEPERALDTLSRLRDLGTRIAIDDFGTGYSSLAYLQRLPITEVKIDKSFVQKITTDASSAAIVRATIELGHTLGFEVVAEGVESLQTWDLLAKFGCDRAQGFYISRPMPASAVEGWLERGWKPLRQLSA